MKIGLTTSGFESWSGGFDFLENLVAAVYAAADQSYEANMYVSRYGATYLAKKYALPVAASLKSLVVNRSLSYSRSTLVDPRAMRKQLSQYQDIFNVHSVSASWRCHQRSAIKRGSSILLPCITPPSPTFDLPWVGYLFDCQHKYLQQYFCQHLIAKRDFLFQQMLGKALHVMVNSLSAKKDFELFYPHRRAKIHALPFSPILKLDHIESDFDVRGLYKIEQPYFIVSNQFWIHKNHSLLFRAFSRFNQHNGGHFSLVCTGSTIDSRFPNYFRELKASLSALGDKGSVRILGRIPRRHQLALMRMSIAVVQPTLFEGGPGGGASYDAVAMGIPLLLSNIDINREVVSSSYTDYFDPLSEDDLVSALSRVCSVGRKAFSSLELITLSQARAINLGSFLINMAKEAMG